MAEAETEEPSDVKHYDVIIIGGGIAGLSAANHLVKNNINDFILLEARDRIGGRIFAFESDGLKLEMGANWIHGVLGNPMYEIAVSNGLVDIVQTPKPHKVIAVTEEGKQIQFQILQETYEAYMCFLHRCEEYFLCQYLPPEGIESVGEHIELEIELYLERIEDQDERLLRRKLFDCLLKRETCITGCHSMTEIDLMELGSYAELQGGNIVLPTGYTSILEPIARAIPSDKILTGYVVDRIKWECDCLPSAGDDSDSDSDQTVIESECFQNVRVESVKVDRESAPDHKIEVKCDNGAVFSADRVICTLPLGVLKEKADEIFVPSLPENKRESIDRLLFGTVNKIFLAYERPFLHPEISEIMLVWNRESDEKGVEISERWYKKIYSFSKVSETVLLGWLSGKEAEYAESLPNHVISEKCTLVLRKFLNDPYVPNPKLCVCTHWKSEPYTRGAYTAIAVGASQCDIENISQPLCCKKSQSKAMVLFAGEHTHSNFYSTVHGAYLSGRTAAQMLNTAVEPETLVVDCPQETSDLSSWIRGISLDDPS